MMANALVKYETIDEKQIKDIMEGKEPRPPEDWVEPSDEKPSGGATATDGDPAKPAIGGPASEH
jgi:cell division protease FtsH